MLPTVQLEQNVARLNRRTFARDAFDLVWVAREPGVQLARSITRRLAVLKCWVDKNGLSGPGTPGRARRRAGGRVPG